jgi:hypothetical protein
MVGHENTASSILTRAVSAVSILAFLSLAAWYEAAMLAQRVSDCDTEAVSRFAAGAHPKTTIAGNNKM